MQRGRGREALRPFMEALGEAGQTRPKAVGVDMNGAYEEEVRAQCPNAEVVFDLFHMMQKYHKEVKDLLGNSVAFQGILRCAQNDRLIVGLSFWSVEIASSRPATTSRNNAE